MNELASRPILWNVGALHNVILMYTLMVLALGVATLGIFRRVELWTSGKPQPERLGFWVTRFFDLFSWSFLQRGVVRERKSGAGIAHLLIYVGFLVLLFTTTMVFLDNDLGIRIYHGNFYLLVTLFSDLLGFGVLIGCGLAAHRRYIQKADQLHNRAGDSLMLIVLALLVVQGFLLEGLRIRATADQWANWSPIGLLVSKVFWGLSTEATAAVHYVVWWFHTATVFAIFAVFPYTKFFHILASSLNLYFKSSPRPAGALPFPGDLEKLMEAGEEFSLGLGTIKDYTWKQLLDLDACTSCGRCQDACPAYLSGKPLSPKWIILDSRNHMLALHAKGELGKSIVVEPLKGLDSRLVTSYLKSGGFPYSDDRSFRGQNVAVQNSALAIGQSVDHRIAGEVIDSNAFWSCTTCMACVEVCPVGIHHVDQIVENRRNMVLMQGEIPHEAQATLKALENRGNPFGDPNDRIKWLTDSDVKIIKPGDSVDYLYWVGCVSAYDPRKQKIAKALVKIMRAAGLSFGILGTAEKCTGDPARRLGEENLYQTLAKQNIETLKSVRFKTLVANCPHCFNTIKNEYPQLGNLGNGQEPEIIHHSQLLKRLLAEQKLNLDDALGEYTFHDPCYLGRYNGEYDAPREVLSSAKSLKIVEMDRSREKGMCCGAGGGHFWMDLKMGDRVNVLRADQAAETGASKIATACPFCMQMMEDGIKLTNREESMAVRDIAEVIAERLR